MDRKRKTKNIKDYFAKKARNEKDPSKSSAIPEEMPMSTDSGSYTENANLAFLEAEKTTISPTSASMCINMANSSEQETKMSSKISNDISEYIPSLIESLDDHTKLELKNENLFV